MSRKIRTQADRRQHATLIDKQGRKWQAVIEKDTMHPCGAIMPKGWRETPGCEVPEVYKTIPDLSDPFSLEIAFDTWIADLEAAHTDYDNRMQTTAAAMDPDNHGALHFRTLQDGSIWRSRTLLGIVGQPPRPVELVKAMRQGNKWALGLVNAATGKPWPRPSWADKFFPATAAPLEQFPDVYPDDLEGDGDFEDASEFPDEGEGEFVPVMGRRPVRPRDYESAFLPQEIPSASPSMLAQLPPEPDPFVDDPRRTVDVDDEGKNPFEADDTRNPLDALSTLLEQPIGPPAGGSTASTSSDMGASPAASQRSPQAASRRPSGK